MKWSLLFLVAGSLLLSCTSRPVSPSKASRRAIDTIYQKKVLMLKPQMDSICALLQDSIYALAVDSILEERMADMNQLVE